MHATQAQCCWFTSACSLPASDIRPLSFVQSSSCAAESVGACSKGSECVEISCSSSPKIQERSRNAGRRGCKFFPHLQDGLCINANKQNQGKNTAHMTLKHWCCWLISGQWHNRISDWMCCRPFNLCFKVASRLNGCEQPSAAHNGTGECTPVGRAETKQQVNPGGGC